MPVFDLNKSEIREYLDEGARVRSSVNADELYEIGREIAERIAGGGKLIIFGNGGSAADSQHIAAELQGVFEKNRKPLAAIALTTNTSILTAIANDLGYDAVFARQLRGLADESDVVIGLSTSGNAMSVLKALEDANKIGCFTIALTGRSGGNLRGRVDRIVRVDSTRTSQIQEVHIAIGHIWCLMVEDAID